MQGVHAGEDEPGELNVRTPHATGGALPPVQNEPAGQVKQAPAATKVPAGQGVTLGD